MIDLYEFYETPRCYTRYLFWQMARLGHPITGTCFEPTVGSGAIMAASRTPMMPALAPERWITNDLDTRWAADYHYDATGVTLWDLVSSDGPIAWTVGNPPFTPALDIITPALAWSTVGVAMHLRASIHEVLKTGVRRTWMNRHPPTGILWLPRFAYQRSKTTGKWTTDNVCACWVVWVKHRAIPQFIRYAPEWVIDELDQETPQYRARMDTLMKAREEVAHA